MINLKTKTGKLIFFRHMYAFWTGNNFYTQNFKHLRHFIVQRKVADLITTVSLVKMEPGIVNWFRAEAERGNL